MASNNLIKRSFLMDEDDFDLIQRAMLTFIKKRRADAEFTKGGYGSVKSANKHDTYIREAENADLILSRMAEIFN